MEFVADVAVVASTWWLMYNLKRIEHSNYHEGFYATGMFSQASADISAESLHIDYT